MASHQAYIQSEPNGPLTLQTVKTPTPSIGQVLVTVLAAPLLSYTREVLKGELFPLVHPLTPGVAAIGRISSAGADSTALRQGQLVFCNPLIRARDSPSDGSCILQGWFGGLTTRARRLMEGPWRNGSWAERMIVPTENLVLLDEDRLLNHLGYSIPQLCWINELMVPLGGWLAAGLTVGATVIVAPSTGHFGGCAVQMALALGARTVIAAGRSEAGLAKVEKLDAGGRVRTVRLSGDVETDAGRLRSASRDIGADVYLDFSPPQAETSTHPQACIAALRHGGQAVMMGGVQGELRLDYARLMINNITVRGNFMYGSDAPSRLLNLLEGDLISLKGLNTKAFAFDELEQGISFAASHAGVAELTVLMPTDGT